MHHVTGTGAYLSQHCPGLLSELRHALTAFSQPDADLPVSPTNKSSSVTVATCSGPPAGSVIVRTHRAPVRRVRVVKAVRRGDGAFDHKTLYESPPASKRQRVSSSSSDEAGACDP